MAKSNLEMDLYEFEPPKTSLPDGEEFLKQLKTIKIEDMPRHSSIKTAKKYEQQNTKPVSPPPENKLIVIESDHEEDVQAVRVGDDEELMTAVAINPVVNEEMSLEKQTKRGKNTKGKKRKALPPAVKKVKLQENIEFVQSGEEKQGIVQSAVKPVILRT